MRSLFPLVFATVTLAGAAIGALPAQAQQNGDPPILPPPNPFCTGVYLAPAWLSDYRFDGFSESDRAPTWQVNLHCFRTDGFYAGVVATGVNFEDTPRTRLEIDYYAGRHIAVWGSDLNLEVLYTSFPTQKTKPSYALLEPEAELSHTWGRLTLSSLVSWTPNDSGAGTAWRLRQGASFKILPWLVASGHVGHSWIERNFDRTFFDAGLTATFGRLSIDGRYEGTDLKPSQCYYTTWCAPGAAVMVKYRILP